MNKRKIDINQIKKAVGKGNKYRTIYMKYQIILSYFKQKEPKDPSIFQVNFAPVVLDLLEQVSSAELIAKLENNNKDSIKQVHISSASLNFQSFDLKSVSKEHPIQEICSCLCLQKKDGKPYLEIKKTKLLVFIKHLGNIYQDICITNGEKFILENADLKNLYETFKSQWSKNEERGRLNEIEKIEKKICRSLYFIGVIIENNIFMAQDQSQRKKKQEQADFGTKSQHKKGIKGITPQVSSTYSFGSMELYSNFSTKMKSQKSNEEDFIQRNKILVDYSQKSLKVVSKSSYNLWEKAEIKNLKFQVSAEEKMDNMEFTKYEINYLSNDVQNILIEHAFKMQKFKDSCDRNPSQYYWMYNSNPYNYYVPNSQQVSSPMLDYNYGDGSYGPNNSQTGSNCSSSELNILKRSLGWKNNYVETKKKDKMAGYQ